MARKAKPEAPPDPDARLRAARKEARELKAHLRDLTANVTGFLALLDGVMRTPSTPDRGSKVAKLSNALELANDRAKRFGLGIDFSDPAWKEGSPP